MSGDAASLARTLEALLFLSSEPLTTAELADAAQAEEGEVVAALAVLAERHSPGRSGIRLRELAGGWTFTSDPGAEEAARRPGRAAGPPRDAQLSPLRKCFVFAFRRLFFFPQDRGELAFGGVLEAAQDRREFAADRAEAPGHDPAEAGERLLFTEDQVVRARLGVFAFVLVVADHQVADAVDGGIGFAGAGYD